MITRFDQPPVDQLSDWSRIRSFLVARRRRAKISQEDLSAKLGFSQNALGMWERGESIPSATAWIAWMQALGVHAVVGSHGTRPPSSS